MYAESALFFFSIDTDQEEILLISYILIDSLDFLNLEEMNIYSTSVPNGSMVDGLEKTEWPTCAGHIAIINYRHVSRVTELHWVCATTKKPNN